MPFCSFPLGARVQAEIENLILGNCCNNLLVIVDFPAPEGAVMISILFKAKLFLPKLENAEELFTFFVVYQLFNVGYGLISC